MSMCVFSKVYLKQQKRSSVKYMLFAKKKYIFIFHLIIQIKNSCTIPHMRDVPYFYIITNGSGCTH